MWLDRGSGRSGGRGSGEAREAREAGHGGHGAGRHLHAHLSIVHLHLLKHVLLLQLHRLGRARNEGHVRCRRCCDRGCGSRRARGELRRRCSRHARRGNRSDRRGRRRVRHRRGFPFRRLLGEKPVAARMDFRLAIVAPLTQLEIVANRALETIAPDRHHAALGARTAVMHLLIILCALQRTSPTHARRSNLYPAAGARGRAAAIPPERRTAPPTTSGRRRGAAATASRGASAERGTCATANCSTSAD
mmetsp:Transcript_150794/g.482640  ORF Transcript_150794/g.482640 Transcript_150794/m.482640 type:complete len:248 (+) Transcript_150794:528-1271(+)